MRSLVTQIELAMMQNQAEEAFSLFQSYFQALNFDDEDETESLRDLLVRGFKMKQANGFTAMLCDIGLDFSITWSGKGGLALVFIEAGCRDAALFQNLCALGADPCQTNRHGDSVLHRLASLERSSWDQQMEPFAVALIRWIPDLLPWTQTNVYGATPLHLAALHNHSLLLRALFERGVSPNLVGSVSNKGFSHVINFNGVSPLHLACNMGQEESVRVLLEYGADPKLADLSGQTPCYYAITPPNKLFCPAYYASIPSEEMVHEKRRGILRLLGEADFTDDTGRTPLLHALTVLQYDRGNYASVLLELGADLDCADHSGRTPLIAAAANRNRDSMKLLLQAGAELNGQDNAGNSALHYLLADSRDEKSARYLIKKGADCRLVNNNGNSAFDLAVENGMDELLELMLANAEQ